MLKFSILLILLYYSHNSFAQNSPDQQLDSIRRPFYQRLDSISTLYNLTSTILDTATVLSMRMDQQSRLNALDSAYDKIWTDRLFGEINFVKNHLSEPISMELLTFDLNRPEGAKYYSIIKALYNKMPLTLKQSMNGKQMLIKLINFNNNQPGKTAPSFNAKDNKGNFISLKMFHNKKYVLLDFWASWCVPCKEEFPLLKKVYASYKSKGLEIISISTDEDLQKWRTAIYKNGIEEWRHFSAKENKPSITSLYFIQGIPLLVLIDKKGLIIGRWVGKTFGNSEALQRQLQNIFEKKYQ